MRFRAVASHQNGRSDMNFDAEAKAPTTVPGLSPRPCAISSDPIVSPEARDRINAILETGKLSRYYHADWTRAFERDFAAVHGDEHYAIAANSGTSALHLALCAAGVERGDEVILPALCFVAAATAIAQIGAIPVICDVEPRSLTMDPECVTTLITERTKAILPVHFWGHPADNDALHALSTRHGIVFIEDCAQSFGAKVRSRQVGTLCDYATYAFSTRKHIACGEGGAVVCRSAETQNRLRVLSNYGKGPDWDDYEAVGYSYRMTEIQSIIALDGLSRVEEEVSSRQAAGRYYDQLLAADFSTVRAIPEPDWGHSAYFKCPILLPKDAGSDHRAIATTINAYNVSCRAPHRPLFRIPWLANYLGRHGYACRAEDYPVANGTYPRLIEVETGPRLPEAEYRFSGRVLTETLRHFGIR